jgi:Cu/Ag efflux protein CusF
MKKLLASLSLLALTLSTTSAQRAPVDSCCEPATGPAPSSDASPAAPDEASDQSSPDPAGHPLRGKIVAILKEKSSLLVAHEEIPGVMAAMTMFLRVDPATLENARAGQMIHARLIKKDASWWLVDVIPAPDA